MEKAIKIDSISIDVDYGTTYIIETDDMYYSVNEKLTFGAIYPCPVLEVAKRFRNNWFDDNGEHPVPGNIAAKINQFNADAFGIGFKENQVLQFGAKRETL
jgi:hypothetical protein